MHSLGMVLLAPCSGADLRQLNRRERKREGGGEVVCCYGENSLEGLVLGCQGYSYFLYSVALQEMHDFLVQFVEDFVW